MFGFGKKSSEVDKREFLIKALSDLIALQHGLAGNHKLEGADDKVNRKALGYVFGFCDGACQVAFGRNSDKDKDLDLFARVLRTLYGPNGEKYWKDLMECLRHHPAEFAEGMMTGGQEYVQWARTTGKPDSFVPMGLVKYLNNW